MLNEILAVVLVIMPIALLTGGLVYWRAAQIAEPERIAAEGLAVAARESGVGMGVLALLFGTVVSFGYVWMFARWPGVTTIYAAVGLLLALGLSIAAAVVRPRHQLGGVPEVIALNLLWGLGYGWLMPLMVRWLG